MMLFKRQEKPVTLPIAVIFLAIAIVWPKLIHSSSRLGHSGDDILRGAIFGLAIGMLLMTGIHMRRLCRSGQRREATKTDNSQK